MNSLIMMLLIISGFLLFGVIFYALGGEYKSDYDPNNPNDIYFNPVVNELKEKSERDRRNW